MAITYPLKHSRVKRGLNLSLENIIDVKEVPKITLLSKCDDTIVKGFYGCEVIAEMRCELHKSQISASYFYVPDAETQIILTCDQQPRYFIVPT